MAQEAQDAGAPAYTKLRGKRRLKAEFTALSKDKGFAEECECEVALRDDNFLNWTATFKGPKGSPYEGGRFVAHLTCARNYPGKPPAVVLRTRMFHINVNDKGLVCVESLADGWKQPLSDVRSVLQEIRAVFAEPVVDSALSEKQAALFLERRAQYDAIAREWTRKWAMGGAGQPPEQGQGTGAGAGAGGGNAAASGSDDASPDDDGGSEAAVLRAFKLIVQQVEIKGGKGDKGGKGKDEEDGKDEGKEDGGGNKDEQAKGGDKAMAKEDNVGNSGIKDEKGDGKDAKIARDAGAAGAAAAADAANEEDAKANTG